MRSVILTIVVLGALVGAFVGVTLLTDDPVDSLPGDTARSPTTSRSGSNIKPVPPPPATQGTAESVIGAGENVWIQSYDKVTGRLVNEFRAARYDPPQDGVVHVQQPEARFFANNGQVLSVAARDGQVIMPEQPKRSNRIDDIDGAPPTRGTLYDVTLSLLENARATDAIVTCKLPVIAFDNDAMRLNTVQHEIAGRIVPADRIPISVRGQYEFDAEGISIRWNQKEGRLEQLEIAHGKRLLIKDPSQFGALSRAPSEPRAPMQFVAADRDLVAQAAADEANRARAPRKPEPAPAGMIAYHAVFNDAVQIFEGDQPVGSADTLRTTFSFDESPAPAPKPVAQAKPATQPTTRRGAAPKPTPQAKQLPLEVRWTGKLTVTPVAFADSKLASGKDRIIEFTGTPVKLQRDASHVEAATVMVATESQRFSARGDDRTGPVTLKDAGGLTLVAPGIDAAGDIVTITGASSAELVSQSDDGQPQKLLASWKEKGTLRLATAENGKRQIESAKFDGSVDVAHPQLKLQSDSLKLAFTTIGDKQLLKAADALGNVTAVLVGEKDVEQKVVAQALTVSTEPTADGKNVVFRSFRAAGNVSLADAKQSLQSEKIEAHLRPVGKSGKVEVEKMTADGKVTYTGEQGAASADVLVVETRESVQYLTLHGSPARITDNESTLSGKVLKLDSTGGAASVIGAGSLKGLARSGAKPQPIEVAWSQSMDYSAKDNRADVAGDVVVTSVSSEGSSDRATGKRLVLTLADAGKQPEKGAIGKKVVKAIELKDEIEISSLLKGKDDQLLRRVHLFAPGVTVTAGADGELGPVNIPTGGRMLYEDRREAVAATQPQQAVRGAVAIEWAKSMNFDPKANQVILEGDVVVVHKPKEGDPLRMLTQKLVAELEPGQAGEAQKLKRVVASEGASFTSAQIRFDAAEAVYDPANERVIARGSDRMPVEVFDQTGASSGSFEELWWNLKTNRPERLKNVTGAVRR